MKKAGRSYHDSTVDYDMDLKGRKAHIIALNLSHQNSIYFIHDSKAPTSCKTESGIKGLAESPKIKT